MELRHEAMKRVFQSLEQENDGRTSRLETSRMPDSDRAKVSGFDKDESGDLNAKPQEVLERECQLLSTGCRILTWQRLTPKTCRMIRSRRQFRMMKIALLERPTCFLNFVV